jgi:hypothetical protein
MTMRLGTALVLALLLGLAVPFLAACGGGDAGLIPAQEASALDVALEQVGDATGSGDCAAANSALRSAQNAFANLPDSTDPRLRERIGDGIAQLARTVPRECRENRPQTTTTTTDTQPTEPTTTEPTTTTTTTTEPTTTTTTTQPTTTTTAPTTTSPPEDPGGISPDAEPGAAP